MEHCKRSGNELSPHTSGSQKNPRESTKGSSSKGEILTAATGRDSGPSAYGKQVRSLLYPGTQTYDLQKNLKFFQEGSPKEFEVLPSTRG
jgi:hypothetical protein